MNKLINALGFQAGWWACVASVRLGYESEAIFFCLFLVCTHLYSSRSPIQEIKLGAWAWMVGVILDTSLQHLSVIEFYGWALGPLSPFWLWALWLVFALTLNSSLGFLKTQPLFLVAMLGLVFGPLTYVAGTQLGAANLDVSAVHIFDIAIAWMVTLPLLVSGAKHLSAATEEHL